MTKDQLEQETLTGFDAFVSIRWTWTSWKGHNLMQMIARVNRVFRDKQGGLVVDYIGVAHELKQALKEYTASKGCDRPTVEAHETYAVLTKKLDVLHALVHGFAYSEFLSGGHRTLAKAEALGAEWG
jgi:type I restriction enzyme, R subunit